MGGIIGHGIDLVDVARISEMLSKHGEHFTARCFTQNERSYADSQPRRRAEHYAARFAAKESVLKALGTGLRSGIAWTEIEVTRNDLGRPGVRLTGRAEEVARDAGIEEWHISLSHTETTAIASVIGWGSAGRAAEKGG